MKHDSAYLNLAAEEIMEILGVRAPSQKQVEAVRARIAHEMDRAAHNAAGPMPTIGHGGWD